MKQMFSFLILIILISLKSETLFEVKDAMDSTVFDVSTDGLRVYNLGDTLMVISASGIRAYINDTKGLSRTFSITTPSSVKAPGTNVLEVSSSDTKMRESTDGNRYTDFSPQNIFLGLRAGDEGGMSCVYLGNGAGLAAPGGERNVFIGNQAGGNAQCIASTYIGEEAGMDAGYTTFGQFNVAIGQSAGKAMAFGQGNVILGAYAGDNFSGNNNCIIGTESGKQLSGSTNVFLGQQTAYNKTSGDYNVFLGPYSGYQNLSGSNNVFLGPFAGYNEIGSDKLYISNSTTTTPLIKGTFPNSNLTFTADVVSLVHQIGSGTNGLSIRTTYNSNSDTWRLYQLTNDNLGLFYNSSLRGTWDMTSGAYTASSDRRLKKNIVNIGSVTDKILMLQPKRYNFISQKDNERQYIGLIAQDLKELFPEFVNYDVEEDIYSIDYAGLSVVAIQAIKELQIKIENLENQVREIDKLKEDMESIKRQIK